MALWSDVPGSGELKPSGHMQSEKDSFFCEAAKLQISTLSIVTLSLLRKGAKAS